MKWLSGLPGIRICYKTLGKKRCFSNIQQTPLEGGTVSLGEDSPVKLVFCFISTEFSCRPTFLCFTNAMLERRWSSKTASKISLQTAEAPFLHAAKKQRKPAEGTSLKSKHIVSSYTRCIALSDEIPVWLNLLRSE